MLATSDLHRSIAGMTIDLARRMDTRKHRGDAYRLCEREHQFQYELTGQVGTVPVETVIKIPFDIVFVCDAGSARDSDLERPQVRVGFEIKAGPPGTIPYAFVKEWDRDDDLNYIGAQVTSGVHAPAIAVQGAGAVSSRIYKVVLHIAFQGYGAPWDADGAGDAGGN